MLIGTYYHHLEIKGRISLPKAFRTLTTRWVVSRGLDSCLYVIPQDSFQAQLEKLQTNSFASKNHRSLVRLIAHDAIEVETDGIGRIHLPSNLIAFAHLENEVVLAGSVTRVEIWNRDTYHTYIDSVSPQLESLVETLNPEGANHG